MLKLQTVNEVNTLNVSQREGAIIDNVAGLAVFATLGRLWSWRACSTGRSLLLGAVRGPMAGRPNIPAVSKTQQSRPDR